uniref:tRNA (N(6)-L-threonylcarbamoyladenosine(37)-C(2))-methylthiotransferase n=1 Tax=Magnetococcus massalia (strain MO-1) TaxID=451514 RepID=A0A1S7LE39_MAGMO|nr:Putative tRNA modification enzyme, MiaB [Candidatus Magnetococcus massalia]
MDELQKGKKRIAVCNMGCRVNQFEGSSMASQAEAEGYQQVGLRESPDVVVVNTCSVTSESDKQARQSIRRIARENPEAKIMVTGCYAQRNPEALAQLPGVELVFGNREKAQFPQELKIVSAEQISQAGAVEPTTHVAPMEHRDLSLMASPTEDGPLLEADAFEGQARAFIQVQNGCDKSCTFCVIPSLRGESRSQSVGWIVAQAERFLAHGYGELVLTGIDLGCYGRDLPQPSSLAELVQQLLTLPQLKRLRLSSLDPMDLDAPLIELVGSEPRICPHLHLSIQSGDDKVLKQMHRETTREALIQSVQKLRMLRPELVLGADIIVGFPTEDEAAFQQSCQLVEQLEIALPHIFRYSDRPGTPASEIPHRFRVTEGEIKQRARALEQVGRGVWQRVAQRLVGQQLELLVEQINGEGEAVGKSEGFMDLKLPTGGGGLKPCQRVAVEVTGLELEKRTLLARIL